MSVLHANIALCLLFAATASAQALTPPVADTVPALDPVFIRLSEAAADGKDWRALAKQLGVLVNEPSGAVLFEIAEFGQRTPVDCKPWPNEGPTIASRLSRFAESFHSLNWIPSGSSTFQRGWIAPCDVIAFHSAVLLELPLAVTVHWMPGQLGVFGSTASEAPAAMDADALQELGTRGGGIKIAVLDLEFGGINTVAAGEVGSVSTHPSQTLASLNADPGSHGTSCVEVIRDMAPDCQILVIREDVSMDTITATNYAISWGAQIISRSVNDFAYPGISASCQAAVNAQSAGVYFVNCTGNAASGHYWESNSYGVGSSGFVRFSGVDETNTLVNSAGTGPIQVFLSYEYTGPSSASFQLALYEDTGSGLVLVGSGTAGAPIIQTVSYTRQPGATYHVAVFQTAAGSLGRMRLVSSWSTAELYEYNSAYGSAMNPATQSNVGRIGAVHQANYTASASPEPYSSRGGGIFNLPAPTVCAPTSCTTISAGVAAFNGTSCACPNFAGFLALHLSRPEYAANPLAYMAAIDLPPTGVDTDSGAGLAIAALDAWDKANPSDNLSTGATSLGSVTTASANHLLIPANDLDWFTFSLTTPGDVTLETSGTSGNTRINLYNGALTQIGTDDDSGTGQFSMLVAAALPAGTYFIRVDEPAQAAVVPAYTLSLTITRNVPTAVTLLTPLDGAIAVPLPVAASWSSATSLAPVTYEIVFALDAGFTNVAGSASGIAGTSTNMSGLQNAQTYFWRVRATNVHGSSGWSPARTLTTAVATTPPPGGGGGGGGDDGGGGCAPSEHSSWWLGIVIAILGIGAVRRKKRTI